MKKRILAFLLAALMVLTLVGCGGDKGTDTKDPGKQEGTTSNTEKEDGKQPDSSTEPEVLDGTNPLTGLPMNSKYENNRPVAVLFNNLFRALPQLGIGEADIIYELPAEGAITRMLGIFQSLDGVGELGSIRSARAYHLEAVLGHDAILVHAGGSPGAYENIPAWSVDNIDGVKGNASQTVFWRDADRKANMGYEHSLLTSGEKVLEYLGKSKIATEHAAGYTYPQAFADESNLDGDLAADILRVRFSKEKTGVFEYDAETKQYKVSQYQDAYIDGNTNEQISVTNVLVLVTDIETIPGDTEGRLDIRMTGEGSGLYFCGGKYTGVRWSKADRNSPFVYTLSDGTPLTMAKGTTYVNIIDTDTSTLEVQ